MSEQIFAVAIDRDVVQISGADAVTYVQGQVSQDVAKLEVGSCAWSFILQPQGKVDAWFRITRTAEDAFICDLDGGWGPALIARLERFKLRVKVDIETLDWQCIAVRGVAASEIDAESLGAPIAAPVDWGMVEGVDLLGPTVASVPGVPVGEQADYDAWRISVGMPALGHEINDSTIPAETEVVDRSASFTKGCYTGQELVARVDSRGNNTPRKLRRLVLASGGADTGAVVHDGEGNDVGVVTTVVGAAALAILRRAVNPGDTVTVGSTSATVEALTPEA